MQDVDNLESKKENIDVDNEVLNDQEALDRLKNCGLLKLLIMPNMRTLTRLLEMLIHYWGPEQELFIIDHMPL